MEHHTDLQAEYGPQVVRLLVKGKSTEPKYTLIDFQDYLALGGAHLFLDRGNYAMFSINGETMRLHRWVLKAPKGVLCDHANHDRLDNRKDNLRLATFNQNVWNRRPWAGCKSEFKGICWVNNRECWKASLMVHGKHHFLGYFHDEEAGARAYDSAALYYFGEFASVNFTDSKPLSAAEVRAATQQKRLRSSRFRGVSFYKRDGNFEVKLTANGVAYRIGHFDNEEDAARAYDDARVKLGLPAVNFPS